MNPQPALDTLRDDLEALHSHAIRMAALITSLRGRLEELRYQSHNEHAPLCRHETPIGEFCRWCAESPEG
jgi:hypothetical protein